MAKRNNPNKLSGHHWMPRWMWWTKHYDNIIRLPEITHRALHILTDKEHKAQPPLQQIETLIHILTKVFRDEFKQELLGVLDCEEEYAYKRGVLVPKKHIWNSI